MGRREVVGGVLFASKRVKMAIWAQEALPAKNRLALADAKLMEDGFERRLSELAPAQRAEATVLQAFMLGPPIPITGATRRPRTRWPVGGGPRPPSAHSGLRLPSAARGGSERGQSG